MAEEKKHRTKRTEEEPKPQDGEVVEVETAAAAEVSPLVEELQQTQEKVK